MIRFCRTSVPLGGMNAVILVIEDEAIIALDLDMSLCDAGFTVLLASSCAEAEGLLADHRPDLVILDVHLRDGDCDYIARALTKDGVPFIVHSGSRGSDLDGVFRSGTLVEKPSDTDALVELVRSMVDLSSVA